MKLAWVNPRKPCKLDMVSLSSHRWPSSGSERVSSLPALTQLTNSVWLQSLCSASSTSRLWREHVWKFPLPCACAWWLRLLLRQKQLWSLHADLVTCHCQSNANAPKLVALTLCVTRCFRLAVPTKFCDSSSCTQNKQARPLQKVLWGISDLPRSPGAPNGYHPLSPLASLGLP